MYNVLTATDSGTFVDVNFRIGSRDRTRHGLHLNYRGKSEVLSYVAHLVLCASGGKKNNTSNLVLINCDSETFCDRQVNNVTT